MEVAMKVRGIVIAALVAPLLCASAAGAGTGMKEQIVGTWTVIAVDNVSGEGQRTQL
jgi:hypothetical protein